MHPDANAQQNSSFMILYYMYIVVYYIYYIVHVVKSPRPSYAHSHMREKNVLNFSFTHSNAHTRNAPRLAITASTCVRSRLAPSDASLPFSLSLSRTLLSVVLCARATRDTRKDDGIMIALPTYCWQKSEFHMVCTMYTHLHMLVMCIHSKHTYHV